MPYSVVNHIVFSLTCFGHGSLLDRELCPPHVKRAMNNLNPINYRIHLEPDLNAFSFSGRTEILLEALGPVPEVTLNAKELALSSCEVLIDSEFVRCPYSVESRKEEINISLPEEMEGKIVLRITYLGKINDRMVGFYRSSYRTEGLSLR